MQHPGVWGGPTAQMSHCYFLHVYTVMCKVAIFCLFTIYTVNREQGGKRGKQHKEGEEKKQNVNKGKGTGT